MLWKNWQYLKNEIYVEDFIDAMMEAGIFTAQNKRDIMMVQPSTRQMKAEKFLNVLIQAGEKGYEMFTTVLHAMRTDNRYTSLMEKLNLPTTGNVMVVHPLVEDGNILSCQCVVTVSFKMAIRVYIYLIEPFYGRSFLLIHFYVRISNACKFYFFETFIWGGGGFDAI